MPEANTVTACLLVIGNEVLSGRTKDANLHWIAGCLTERGIRLAEARVVPDVESVIIAALDECRANHDYVFTTGGIGPTHDDITASCVARAFGVALERNAEAVALLESYIPTKKLNEARLKMADIPAGAALIENAVSKAPGFRIGNVYVMAGVPKIMQSMFASFVDSLASGPKMHSRSVAVYLGEGTVAGPLGELQAVHPEVDIGSYPFKRSGQFGCTLVSRATDTDALGRAVDAVKSMIVELGAEPFEEDLIAPRDPGHSTDY